jgi:hypothetical protein
VAPEWLARWPAYLQLLRPVHLRYLLRPWYQTLRSYGRVGQGELRSRVISTGDRRT